MNFIEYQEATGKTAVYPCATTIEALTYVTLGLTGEAGELANKVKKLLRDKGGAVTLKDKIELQYELGDCLWYVSQMAKELGFNLEAVARRNVEKLQGRAERGTLKGSGDGR